jgi:hypothetical protein
MAAQKEVIGRTIAELGEIKIRVLATADIAANAEDSLLRPSVAFRSFLSCSFLFLS